MGEADAPANSAALNELMTACAKAAVDYSRKTHGVDLDYSIESIERVEQILSDLYKKFPQGRLARFLFRMFAGRSLEATCNMFGGYIGEVFRRERGGAWVGFGNGLCLCKDGNRIFPPSKVYKRLTDGENDNVWFYAQVVMNQWWGQGPRDKPK